MRKKIIVIFTFVHTNSVATRTLSGLWLSPSSTIEATGAGRRADPIDATENELPTTDSMAVASRLRETATLATTSFDNRSKGGQLRSEKAL